MARTTTTRTRETSKAGGSSHPADRIQRALGWPLPASRLPTPHQSPQPHGGGRGNRRLLQVPRSQPQRPTRPRHGRLRQHLAQRHLQAAVRPTWSKDRRPSAPPAGQAGNGPEGGGAHHPGRAPNLHRAPSFRIPVYLPLPSHRGRQTGNGHQPLRTLDEETQLGPDPQQGRPPHRRQTRTTPQEAAERGAEARRSLRGPGLHGRPRRHDTRHAARRRERRHPGHSRRLLPPRGRGLHDQDGPPPGA